MLDKLFAWDYDDPFWQKRRAATTVVSIACDAPDEYCFCTSVGGAPDNQSGADLWLAPTDNGLIAEPQTEKGQALVDAYSDLFSEGAYKCLGCGACAFVCPTCHCFDISDDADFERGRRLRTWDSCGFSMFTQHASGHNPRPSQDGRYRQRVMHKFKYYVEKFDVTACVGCGRCSVSCPVDMNMCSVVSAIASGPAAEDEP